MGAKDNIAAGLTGAAIAGQDILGKLLDYKLRRKAKQEDYMDEMNYKLPYEQAINSSKAQTELANKIAEINATAQAARAGDYVQGQDILDVKPDAGVVPNKSYNKAILPILDNPGKDAAKQAGIDEKSQIQQDKLEKEYRDLHTKVLSNRSGGLGLQDQKVNQAIHLRGLLDQYYDPQSGEYKVPKSQYEELAIGLANLVSGSNTVSDSMRQGIMQRTAKGDINGAIAYITGGTPTASSKDVFKNLADSIDRQGSIAEDLRNKYHEDLKSMAPTRLAKDRRGQVEKQEIGSSYKQYLDLSPSNVKPTTSLPVPVGTDPVMSQIQNQLPKGAKIKSIKRLD